MFEENIVGEPGPDGGKRPKVILEWVVPVCRLAPQTLFCVEAGVKEEFRNDLNAQQRQLLRVRTLKMRRLSNSMVSNYLKIL